MALPTVKYPTYTTKVPSTGKAVKYRPFTVGEEKVMLTALEGNDDVEILDAVKLIIESCYLKSVTLNELTTYDIEWLFLQARINSVAQTVDMNLRHAKCEVDPETTVLTRIPLDQAQVVVKKDGKYIPYVAKRKKSGVVVMLDEEDKLGVTMVHPNVDQMIKIESSVGLQRYTDTILLCITSVFQGEEVWTRADFTGEELLHWYDSLTSKQKEKMGEFVASMPELRYETVFKCPACGKEEPLIFEGLSAFFG
jgi:hypothetical protein